MRGAYILSAALALGMISCDKRPDPVPNPVPGDTTGELRISFQNMAGAEPLVLDDNWYQNHNGDSIRVTTFKYYISNIKLTREDDSVFYEPESYHLVDASDDASASFVIKDIPAGKYKSMNFMIGVDPARNTSGAQTGALDPIHGMFWTWNTGYIMAKLEGYSPQSTSSSERILYHTGGFSGQYSVLRNIRKTFPSVVEIKDGSEPNVHMNADVLEWFKTPNTIKIAELSTIMEPGETLSKIADNYADMFSIEHID